MTTHFDFSYNDVVKAATVLKGHAVRTPLLENPWLNERAGGRVFIKPECLQHTGSFKFRGAFYRLSCLSDDERQRGVVAFSSGNHAQGVAYAAKLLSIKATIVMPKDAPRLKMDNTRAFGAEVVEFDRYSESREAIAAQIAKDTGAVVVPSYDDLHIMAGQGSMGLEMAEDLNALGVTPDQALICCGGGGLSSGSFTALKHHFPSLDGYVVEPEGYDDTMRSLASGVIEGADVTRKSICDALLSPAPGDMTFEVLKGLKVQGLAVSDDEALDAVAFAAKRLKCIGEPGGSVALAAVLSGKVATDDKVTVLVISGGNIDPAMLAAALEK